MNNVKSFLSVLKDIDQIESDFRSKVHEVTMQEFRVMAMINEAERDLNIRDYSQIRSIAAQGIGRVVERLRRRGFVATRRNERDKREKFASLTSEGERVLLQCHAILEQTLH